MQKMTPAEVKAQSRAQGRRSPAPKVVAVAVGPALHDGTPAAARVDPGDVAPTPPVVMPAAPAPAPDPRGTCTCQPRPWPVTHTRFVRGRVPGAAGRQERFCGGCGAVQDEAPLTDVGIKDRTTRA